MRERYLELAGNNFSAAVALWNSNYPGFHIDGFLTSEKSPDDIVLQEAFEFTEQFPDREWTPENFEDRMNSVDHQRNYKISLGWNLTDADIKLLMVEIASKYYEVATMAVRAFDKNHLIFTDRFNWISSAEFGSIWDSSLILRKAASKNDEIAGFSWFRYCRIPESNTDGLYSFDDLMTEMKTVYQMIMDDGDEETVAKPNVVLEWTIHGDCQKEWDGNYPVNDVYPCEDPKNLTLVGAPAPHGIEGTTQECLNAENYNNTETGIIYWNQDPERERGKHQDYADFMNRVVNCYHQYDSGGETIKEYIVPGAHYHGYYDLGFDPEFGNATSITNNWGIINPKANFCDPWTWPIVLETCQYEHLIENLGSINGSAQQQAGGFIWNPNADPCN
jgi:hypothetical protein